MNTAYVTPDTESGAVTAQLLRQHEDLGETTDVFLVWSAVTAAGIVALVDGHVALNAAKTGLHIIVTGFIPDECPPAAKTAIGAVLARGAARKISLTLLVQSVADIPVLWRPALDIIDPAALSALGL